MKRLAIFLAFGFASAWAGDASAATVLHEFVGDSNGDRFGTAVAGGVDINNDDVPDVLVGASLDDNNGVTSGMVRIFSGQSGEVLRSIDGASAGDVFGEAVAGLLDIDGDSFDDFIVGAPFDDNTGVNAGSAQVFSGQHGSVLFAFDGDATEDTFGVSVSDAGDINNDGIRDIVIGATQISIFGPDGPGYARVFSGADSTVLYTFVGGGPEDNFGQCVSGVGDVNGDQYDDVVIGAIQFNQGVPGYARVFSGMDGSILYEFTGTANDDEFGYACADAGDANKDGVPDIIVGAIQRNTGGGYARVFSGADGSVLHTFLGEIAPGRFGNSVDGVGDMDGDGHDDVIVGAPNPNVIIPVAGRAKSTPNGYARVFSGKTGAILMDLSSLVSDDGFGVSVAGAGDLNGDAVPDVVVGAWQDQNGGPGYVRVYAGERPAPPGCAPVRGAASALGAAAFAAAAGALAWIGLRKNFSRWESPTRRRALWRPEGGRSARSAG